MARPINFQQIHAFKTVMETGTTTHAAEVLHTTQPSVSRRLTEFQAAIELKLFDLYKGRLRPTPEGRQLYQTVQRHFAGLEKIETAARVLRKSGTQVLRIGSTPTLATGMLPHVVSTFMEQNPEAYVNIQTLRTPRLKDYLEQGLIDFFLTTGRTANHSDLFTEPLSQSYAVCVLPQDHPLVAHDVVDLHRLQNHRLILLDHDDDLTITMRLQLGTSFGEEGVTIETNSSLTICALVSAGAGIGIVNPFVANTFSRQLAIREIRPRIPVDVTLVRSRALVPSMLTSRFVQLLMRETLL